MTSAAMTIPLRFRDNEYKNWLKVGNALIRCKESLHPFVDTEVKKFHANIKQKVQANSGSHCNSCTSKSIRHTGGWQGVWKTTCKNCDKWLQQLQLEHVDPNNRNIRWKNADICRWPIDGYEVAKVYMPKGQEKTKKLPEDLDPAAVLSLFKYCKWFKRQVPNSASIVSDLIDIRNELFHSGDLKVKDNKKDICIDNTIQLLTELHINGNVVSELQMLKREDIDINYRETEVKVFNTILTAVKGKADSLCADQIQLSGDINIAQTNISSLQAMQLQQGQEMQEMKDNTKQNKEKLVTVETDIKDIKMELEQEREIHEKMKSFLLNNPDIDDKNISENMQKIENIVTDLQPKLDKAEKDISELRTTMERRMSSIENRQDVLEKNFAEMAVKDGKKQSCLQNDVESLQVELLSRYKSVRTIPISYFDEKEVGLLENLYTDIVINNKGRNNREKDQTAVSYKHLFKGRQRIILTGLAGSGKSTFSRKIVNRWCNLKEDKKTDANAECTGTSTHDSLDVRDPSTNNTSMTDSSCTIADEDLRKFDLLFYINSPAISNESKLVEVLCNQCIRRELVEYQDEMQKKVSKILIDQPEKILMIFDGLDELGHTPDFLVELFKRSLYSEVTVLMVTRPWHISKLGLKSEDHYDLHLEIHGFSRDNALRFVKKVFEENNRISGQTIDANISSEAEEIMLSFKNVPLLLLFLTQIWYIDLSLPHRLRELYNKMIDGLFVRYLKRTKNRHIDSNLDQGNMDSSNWFREQCLNSACRVAYYFLLEIKGVSEVTLQDLTQQLGHDAEVKLNALQDYGIISNIDFFSPLEQKRVSVTFLHMSVQEYLASMYLVQNEGAFQLFLQSLKTLNDVLRHENLFIFVCGLNAGQGHKALIKICEVCDVDSYVQKYRQEDDDDGGYSYIRVKGDIENLNKMYKACIDEMDSEEPLQIPDIIAQNDEWFKLVISRQSSHHVRSLTLLRLSEIHCVPDLSSLCHLTSLTLGHLSLSEEQSRSLCSSVSSFTQLQKLELVKIILTDGVIDLSNLHHLKFLKLESSTNDGAGFINLSACTKLEKLELANTTLDDGVLDLKKLTGLTHLKLSSLKKSLECTVSLCNSLSACTKLKKLVLSNTALYDGTLDSNALTNLTFLTLDSVWVLDRSSRSLYTNISQLTCLKTLELMNTNLHDGILDLNTHTQLTHLTLVSVKMSKKCSRSLCNCIRSGKIAHIKSLHLDNIALRDGVLDLTTLTSLTDLELKTSTMFDKCAKSLCSSLGACTKLEKLYLYDITLCSGVLDLETLTSLTQLTLSKLTMSEECTKSLSNSISACTNLTLLWLEYISLYDTKLDLKNLRDLCILQLADVTMSDECLKILKESIKHCPKLRSFGIQRQSAAILVHI